MIQPPCNDCRKGICPARCEMLRKSVRAYTDDKPVPECEHQVLTWQARQAA